jgi:hypothetical protein
MKSSSKTQSLFKLFIGLLIASAVGALVKDYFKTTNKGSLEEILNKTSEKVNNICPIMIDEETRMDSTSIIGGNQIVYHQTLINFSIEELDLDYFKNFVDSSVTSAVINNKEMEPLRTNGVIITYNYSDKNGLKIHSVSIEPN